MPVSYEYNLLNLLSLCVISCQYLFTLRNIALRAVMFMGVRDSDHLFHPGALGQRESQREDGEPHGICEVALQDHHRKGESFVLTSELICK